MGTGTPLVQALGALERQQRSTEWRRVIGDIRVQVEEGAALSTAMESHAERFNVITRSLVAAGESSGQMKPMLDRLARITRQQLHTRNVLIGSLTYPIVLIFVSIGVLGTMIGFVMPRFEGLYANLGSELPASTQLLVDLSDILTGYWWAIVPGVLVSVGGLVAWARRPEGRSTLDGILVQMPLIGPILRGFITARVIRVLGVLLESKVQLLDALELTKQAAGNVQYAALIADAIDAVTEGDTLTGVFRRSPLMSPTVVEALETGEQSGKVGQVLSGIAEVLDEDNEIILRSISSIIEPIILVMLGAVVGVVALSMFLPLFDLTATTSGGG
jgi:type II secretory pathway component PulF